MASYPADTEAEAKAVVPNHDLEEEELHYSNARQLVSAVTLPMVLHSAFRLGLFDIIAKAGLGAQLSPSQIVANLPSKNPDAAFMVDRMLRLLASHSVLTCSCITNVEADEAEAEGGDMKKKKKKNSGGIITRVYGLTPVAKYFVRNPDLGGASLGSALAMVHDKVFIDSWYALDDAILEGGIPFNRVHGAPLFEYHGRDPRFGDVFNQAMIDHSAITVSRILDNSIYKGFEHLKSLVDVGGGLGMTIGRITAKYPTIKGINFDLPHVVQHAPAYPGVQHIGGDMFDTVPQGDAILLKGILHDWDDVQCLKLLKKCYDSLPESGKVIVIDALVPVNPDTSSLMKVTYQMDMLMLVQSTGGKERSEEEFTALATAAGFQGIKKECIVCCWWVMELYK